VANLKQDELRRLARLGAVARIEQLRQEEAAIRAEFPELFGRGRQGGSQPSASRRGRPNGAAASATSSTRGRGRRTMSAAQRKAVSERMRKYWADRRKAKAKGAR
jgi:hypothetical protein